ncbi:MAG TPA: hypothetical protein VFU93_08425 [Acidimicrobiales bacterium]|nr:hypothetical protein [Acidimicrobiales bacterium]
MRIRGAVLLLLAALVAALLVLDRDVSTPDEADFGSPRVSPMPVADRDDVLASTWYCAAGTATSGGSANLTVVIANASETRAAGAVTWYPVGADPVSTPVDIPASGSVSLVATEEVDAQVVSAVVDVRGGGIAVEHVVSGSRGASVAPCASDASPTWYFANGVTERDAVQVLALFNPFPDDAIVDISFATDAGRVEPAALSGLPVAAGTTTLVDVHDHVRRQAITASAVVARNGRLVVDRVQSFDASTGRRGISLALGAPDLAEAWTFPEGLWADGLQQRWHVFNPSPREAQVSLELVASDGDPIEPVDLTVPPKSQLVIDASSIDRVAAGVAHSSTIVSLNGVPVVAERSLDARAPSARRGWTSSLGSPLARARWVLPLGEASGNTDEWVVVHNPSAEPVTVSVTALAGGQLLAVEGLQDLDIAPGERIAVRLGDHIRRSPLPLLVEATGDVVVERDLYRVGATGITTIIGIPLP